MKGQATSLSHILIGLTTIGIVALFIFFFITRGQEIQVRVEENEIMRRLSVLGNVLISSKEIAFSEYPNPQRGVLDKDKLDQIQSNPQILERITYPEKSYLFKVVDMENNQKWFNKRDFNSNFKLPVSIRYPDGDIHIGFMYLKFE
ncbi:MAG: hypothetical protein QXY45_00190 [Candidatus Aenigmatarchaeota archaeon]